MARSATRLRWSLGNCREGSRASPTASGGGGSRTARVRTEAAEWRM